MIDEGFTMLEIYRLAHDLAIEIRSISLAFPKFAMHEEGSQIRRSSKSVPSRIGEAYCLRRYRKDFLLFLS
jgi:four helix bundle protein